MEIKISKVDINSMFRDKFNIKETTNVDYEIKKIILKEIMEWYNYDYDFMNDEIVVYAQTRERKSEVQFRYKNIDETLFNWLDTMIEEEDDYWNPYIDFVKLNCSPK